MSENNTSSEMKIIGINEKVATCHPDVFSGFNSGFPIEVEEVDQIDPFGEKYIKRVDDKSDRPKIASKIWFVIGYDKNE